MKTKQLLASWVITLVVALSGVGMAGRAEAQVTTGGQALPEVSKQHVLLVLGNSSAMQKADSHYDMNHAYLMLLALLPEDAGIAYTAAKGGADTATLTWHSQSDALLWAQLQNNAKTYEASKAAGAGDMVNTLKGSISTLMPLASGQPITVLATNLPAANQMQRHWSEIGMLIANSSVSMQMMGYAGNASQNEKTIEEIAKGFSLNQEADGNYTGNGHRLYQLAQGQDERYFAAALADVQALLTRQLGVQNAQAAITLSPDGAVAARPAMPTIGVLSTRVLVQNIPQGQTIYLRQAGADIPLEPVMTYESNVAGNEHRVYWLTKDQAAGMEALQWGESTAGFSTGTVNSSAEPSEGTTTPSPESAGDQTTVDFYYAIAADIQTQPNLLKSTHLKNKPFLMDVRFENADMYAEMVNNLDYYEMWITATNEKGIPAEFPVVYDEKTQQMKATILLTQSGLYTFRSEVRSLQDTTKIQRDTQPTPLQIKIENEAPKPAQPELETVFLMNDPLTNTTEGLQTAYKLSGLFSDADNDPDSFEYCLLENMPTSASEFDTSAYRVLKVDRFTADLNQQEGTLKITPLIEKVSGTVSDDAYLMVRDDENEFAVIRVAIQMINVSDALQAVPIQKATLKQAEDGQQKLDVTFDVQSLPQALTQRLARQLQVKAALVEEGGDWPEERASQLELATEGLWQGTVAKPAISGEYAVWVRAALVDAESGKHWEAEGWNRSDLTAPLKIKNAAPRLLANEEMGNSSVWLERVDGVQAAQGMFLDMDAYFAPDGNMLSYGAHVLDKAGAQLKVTQLWNTQGEIAYIGVDCTLEQIDQLMKLKGNQGYTSAPSEQGVGGQLAAKGVTLAFGSEGDYVVRLSAVNTDSQPTTYTVHIKVRDRLLHYIRVGVLTLMILLALVCMGLIIRRIRTRSYGATLLKMILRDPQGEQVYAVSLEKWGKRKIVLSTLLLNAMVPMVEWLDGVAPQIAIKPKGRRIVLELNKSIWDKVDIDPERKGRRRTVAFAADAESVRIASTETMGSLTLRLKRADVQPEQRKSKRA